MNDKQKSICRRILDHYGVFSQKIKTVEECAELITAILHNMEDRVNEAAVIDELADVSIMLEQMIAVYGRQKVDSRIDAKLRRQQDRIKKTTEQEKQYDQDQQP